MSGDFVQEFMSWNRFTYKCNKVFMTASFSIVRFVLIAEREINKDSSGLVLVYLWPSLTI